MKALADFLEKMDAYFEGKSSTERLALILLPALLVAYLAWSVLNPPAVAAHEKSIADKKHMQKKLHEDKAYLKSITVNGDRDYHVKAYDKKIALAHKRAESYRQKITVLDKNLFKLSNIPLLLINSFTALVRLSKKFEMIPRKVFICLFMPPANRLPNISRSAFSIAAPVF